MKKCKLLLYFSGIAFIIGCSSTKNSLAETSELKFQISVQTSLVEIDNLNRIYLVDHKNNLINYKPDLKEQYRYSNRRSGKVSSIDVNNPLKVLAFYTDFNQIKLFDNTLSTIKEINLSDKFADVSACGTANDGNIWIFDPVQFKLIKINDNGDVLLETSNVNDFGMFNLKITDIRERGNYVVLCDRNVGFYFFDNLGQYMYSYEAKDILSFQFDGRNVFYFTPTGLKSYSIKFKERQMISYPLNMNKPRLKYVLYHSGSFYEVNESGINVVNSQE
jgi:hypothetical protein